MLALGLAVTYVQQEGAVRDEQVAQQFRFDLKNKEITLRIEQRLAAYEQVLRGTRGLFEASESVDRSEFSRYVANLHLEAHYPGIQGIGFSPLMLVHEKASFTKNIRQHDWPDYAIRPEGERPAYAPVLYIEPLTGPNLRALGYDVYSDPVRRAALEQARDTDNTAITAKVVLVQEADQLPKTGFIMYLPVYRTLLRPHIRGWVSAPFRMEDLMQGILGDQIDSVDLEIFDGVTPSEATLMVDTDGQLSLNQTVSAQFQSTKQILVSAHTWTLKLRSTPAFDASFSTKRATELRVVGILMSTLLAWLVFLLTSARGRAISLAENMTQELREKTATLLDTQTRLSTLINTLPDLVWLKNVDGVYLACNPRFECFFGAEEKIIRGKTDYDFVEKTLADSFRANDKAALAADCPRINEEWVSFADDGHRELLETTKTPMRDASGRVIGVLGISHDITQRKNMETTLRDSEQRFRHLIDNNNAIILQIDPASGKILDANTSACHFYGWSHDEMCAKHIQDINELTPEKIAQERAAALHEQRNYFVFPHRLANGEIKTVEVHSTPIAVGVQTLLVSIIHDITQRVHYEKHVFELMRMQKAILDSHIVGIVKLTSRQFIWANAAFAEMLGYTPEELVGQPSRIVYASDAAYSAFAQTAYPILQRGDIFRTEIQYQCKDGSLRWFEISGGKSDLHSEESIWAFIDINTRKQTEAALQKSEAFKLAILNSVPAEIAVLDHNGVILAVNGHWQNFATENGIAPGTMPPQTGVGTNYLSICQGSTGAQMEGALDACAGIAAVLDGTLPSFQQEYPCHSPQEQRWFTMTVTPLAQDGLVGAVITHTNLTERKLMENVVRQLAFYDTLTQLPNRRLLKDRLSQSMAASKRSDFYGALMFLDLDNFKPLNDTHGHDVGDLLLIEVAERLKNCVREMDTVARFGGDEFVVMISELATDQAESTEQAALVAEKIRLTLAAPYRLTLAHEGQANFTVEHHCTASIGVTLFVDHDASQENILKWADLAMYQAKDAGRNRVKFYEHLSTDQASLWQASATTK